MGNKPLISIITPSYNSGKYLEECIKSVFTQDYKNVEHIIQDGGSGDNTLKILKKYSLTKYRRRIKWNSEPDRGQTDAMNKALKRSKGDFILVLNADDALLPNACAWGLKNMRKYPRAAVVYGDEYVIDEKGKILQTYEPYPFDYDKLICSEVVPPAQAAFIRRSAFEKVGFHFNESFPNCADFEIWVRLGLKFPIVYERGVVSKFRWHPKSKTTRPDLINDFIDEKRKVIDDLFSSKSTPEKLKRLRKRACAGLNYWAAFMQIDSGAKYGALRYFAKAVLLNERPSIKLLRGYLKYWKEGVKKYQLIYGKKS